MFLADWLFFTLDVTLMQLAGILICVACSLGVVVYKTTRPKDKKEELEEQQSDSDDIAGGLDSDRPEQDEYVPPPRPILGGESISGRHFSHAGLRSPGGSLSYQCDDETDPTVGKMILNFLKLAVPTVISCFFL